jgi:hypothetical protein
MTKKQTGLLAAALCSAGLVSAIALAYTLNRPLVVAQPLATHSEIAMHVSEFHASLLPEVEPTVVELAPVVIVSEHRSLATRSTTNAVPRDIADMRCTGWRSLEQGPATGQVRLCE